MKGVMLVNYADIIWKLIEKLLSEKEQEEKKTNDQDTQAED